MHNDTLHLLESLQRCQDGGEAGWLVTIAKTHGASPRPSGSMLLLTASGHQFGSISGGCIEEALLEDIRLGKHAGDRPCWLEYGLAADDNERLGLPCGGYLTLLLEHFLPRDPRIPPIAPLLQSMHDGTCWRRTVDIASGRWAVEAIDRCAPIALSDSQFRQDFGPRHTVLLIGANALGIALAELLLALEYRVIVCDPRSALREDWPLGDVELTTLMPDDAVRHFAQHDHAAVITLTHDPRIDDMALMEALTGPAFYVGALGSAKTSAARRQRLLQLDLTPQQIARLRAPVGLAIGSKTPLEIAVSVAAELTAVLRGAQE